MDIRLQIDSDSLGIETSIIKDVLSNGLCRYMHSVVGTTFSDVSNMKIPKESLPIGDLYFMSKFFKMYYGIKALNPVEIPDYLRIDEFLLRDYRVASANDIKKAHGTYFLKNVSRIKSFAGVVDLDTDKKDWLYDKDVYIISEVVDIQAEYRCYIIDGKMENCINYNGSSFVQPDISKIQKIIGIIGCNEKWLKSYVLDVMVTPRGTAIVEIGNFMSVGLYGTLWGDSLVYAYRDGVDYVLNSNINRFV